MCCNREVSGTPAHGAASPEKRRRAALPGRPIDPSVYRLLTSLRAAEGAQEDNRGIHSIYELNPVVYKNKSGTYGARIIFLKSREGQKVRI